MERRREEGEGGRDRDDGRERDDAGKKKQDR